MTRSSGALSFIVRVHPDRHRESRVTERHPLSLVRVSADKEVLGLNSTMCERSAVKTVKRSTYSIYDLSELIDSERARAVLSQTHQLPNRKPLEVRYEQTDMLVLSE